MADRYWVGGTANWDGTAGTKWATTSGGAGGASVPTSADDVFFTNLSTGTCTIATGNTGAKSINCTGFTGTLAGTAAITVSGSITLVAGMTYTYSGALTLNGTGTLTSAAKSFAGTITINGSGITVTLGDALTVSSGGNFLIQAGTFTTNNYNLTLTGTTIFNSSSANARTINLGSSTISIAASGTALTFSTNTNLTFNAGTSTIICSGTSINFSGGPIDGGTGVTFYDVQFTATAASTHNIRSINTFNNLTITAPSAAGVTQVTFDSRQTISGTLSTTGTAGNRRVWFRGVTYGLAQTLTINSATSLTDADFRDIYVIGTAAPISGTRIGDLRGCRGITFSTPKTVYWNLPAGGNWSANAWASSSGGAVSTDNFPLAQDTAVIENTGLNTSATVTFDSAVSYTGTIDMSTRTNAMTLATSATFTIYGDWKNGSGTTIGGGGLGITFSGRNTQSILCSGKSFNGGLVVDSYGGTVQLSDAFISTGNAFTITNGTFDTKNFSFTAGGLFSTNSNVRTITLGSSTVTFSSSISLTNSTNLSFNAGTSSVNLTGVSSGIDGSVTFYNVSFTNSGVGTRIIQGACVFNNLTVSAGGTGIVEIRFYANQTITGILTVAGITAVRRIFVRSDILGATRTLNVATLSATDCDFRDIAITGAAAGSSPTRAGNCGGNTGITFPAAKTVYWNLAGAQNWSATAWAPGSGGTPDINQFPLAQDTAVFDNTGSVTGTITIDTAWNIGTFDASLRTSAMTLNKGNIEVPVYKNWTAGTGITYSSQSAALVFSGTGTQTITSNGVSFNFPITIQSFAGIIQLGDALVVPAGRTLTLTAGTFDAVSYNVTTNTFIQNTNTGTTLKIGSGTWTLTGTGAVWDYQTPAPPSAFYKGTANIVLSNTSTSARTFSGGGLSYNKLTIGGTTGVSTLTISGNNQFTELASTKTVAHTIALGTTTQTFGKWTVTGTVGNVVTLTGTGVSHILAGACTSGIDYLAMGSIGFAATSPGEFYAGANSTATAAVAPVYLTAKPADSTRYWVGGTGNWSDTARWSTGSGGAGGASVPRSHDDVVFDSASNATAYTATVNAVTGGIRMKALTIAGPATGNVTLAGSTAMVGIHGNVTLPATGLTRTYTGNITLSSNSTGLTFTTNGVTLASQIVISGQNSEWSLGSALNNTNSSFNVFIGSFDTANYNITAAQFTVGVDLGTNTAIIPSVATLGSSTITLSNSNPFNTGFKIDATLNVGTSQFILTAATLSVYFSGKTFYNVAFTSTSAGTVTFNGANSFNNLSFTGITSSGLKNISLTANQTVTGTLTFSAGTDATMRHFVQSNTIGTTRTITAAAVSMTDVDFRDVTIAGAAAPASGTRIGDGKGNSGITFTAAANKYWNLAAGGNWGGAIGWATSSGGTPAINNFPLAQDTCFFEATGLNSGATVTVNQSYNIGTIDMSARTANTMTLSGTAMAIYGNWINGTGTTLSGAGTLTVAGRGTQTITSAGRTFVQEMSINSPGGSVTFQDAFTSSNSAAAAIGLVAGTVDANIYNVTLSAGGVSSSNTNVRTIALGSGTWVIGRSSGAVWLVSSTATVTGTGTISLTAASAKTFGGGDIAYTNITLNQGGAGTLSISGNNTFKDITNTYKATGATTINMQTATQRVSQWTAAGEATRLLTIQGTSASSPCTLIHTGTGTAADVDYLVVTGVRAY